MYRSQSRSVASGWRRLSFASLAIASLVLSGCAAATTTTTDETTEGLPAEPVQGGSVNIVQVSDIGLNGWFAQVQPNLAIQRLLFNSLTQTDVATGIPQPSLATSWELTESNTVISFVLRDDVVFHDGKTMTSADVIASIEALRADGVPSQVKSVANLITSMDAVSDTEITISLEHAVTNLFDFFEMMPIVDGETVAELFEGETFNGTGPFRVENYVPGQKVEMVRFDEYWDGAANLDTVTITAVSDSQAMLAALQSGQAQIAVDLAPLDATSLREDPAFDLYNAPAADAAYYLASNVDTPLLSTKEARQGIASAINRERILDQVLGGNGVVSAIPWSPSSSAFDESLRNYYSYDPEGAKAALEAAGVAGETITVSYDANSGIMTGIAQVVINDLEQAGLRPVADPLQQPDFLTKLRGSGFEGIFINVHGFGQLSPATLVNGAFPFNAFGNASGFDNQEYKDLAVALWKETDDQKVAENMEKLNEFFLDQQFVTDLISSYHTYTISSSLEGLDSTILSYLILDRVFLN
jgi:peptide/nickel transport system substrate-binding protein